MTNKFKSPDIGYRIPCGCGAIFEISEDGPFVQTEADARCRFCGTVVIGWPTLFSLKLLKEPD